MMSNFLKWANQRIEKEILDNEKLEAEFGESAHKKESTRITYTDEERGLILEEIQGYLDEGLAVRPASKKAGVHYKTYYKWKRDFENKELTTTE